MWQVMKKLEVGELISVEEGPIKQDHGAGCYALTLTLVTLEDGLKSWGCLLKHLTRVYLRRRSQA